MAATCRLDKQLAATLCSGQELQDVEKLTTSLWIPEYLPSPLRDASNLPFHRTFTAKPIVSFVAPCTAEPEPLQRAHLSSPVIKWHLERQL